MVLLRIIILVAGLLMALPAWAGSIAFKLGENGDPTDGGTDPAWTLQGSGSYEKTSDPLVAVYGVDLDADTVDAVTIELRTPSASVDNLFLNGGSNGGIGLAGNTKDDINTNEVLLIRFGSDVVINGFSLAAFSGESADYSANGSTWTTTVADVTGLSISLPAGNDFEVKLTNPAGLDQFRLKSLIITPTVSHSYAPKGNHVRLRPLQNRGTSGLDDDYWQYPDYTAQDILQMIEQLQPTVLERYISGPFNPDTLVPVDPGEPTMTVAEFLNASMAVGAPGCTLSPRVSLEVLYSKPCPWSTDYTNCFYAVADNLYNLPIDPPIRTISLDNWGAFSDAHSDEEIHTILTNLVAMGWERIAVNYIGGNRNSYGIVKVGMFGVDQDTYLPKMSAYAAIAANESIEDILLYIDFRSPAEAFSQLPPDEQADKLYAIASLQETNDFTFVWPVIGADFWDVTKVYTSTNGPYGGMSILEVMIDAMRRYNQVHTPLMDVSSSGTGELSIRWPKWGEGYQLSSATSLVNGMVWVAVTNETVVGETDCSVTMPVDKPRQFFKLIW
ncbi:MAG: hypothetical protein K9M45_03695 [Kiritimatiellales bacterium]|nr:hypothetical protein [Kiritimatiellales bacterium]